MDDIVSYQFAQVRQRRDERQEIQYELILRQQPKQSRMCGIGEKADRRPIDPPPIIQLKVYDASLPQSEKSSFLQNPYFFMYASLVAPDTDEELHLLRDGKTRSTTGSVVSSLYHLKDIDNSDAGFFVFPDLSVRMEGTYRLKLSLFEIIGREVYHCKSIFSDIFIVYSAKRFPGMEESTFLSRSFADQGLKIRIRKEIRIRRRLAKRDRKELELIDQSMGNRLKRQRGDGKREDNESGESSDVDMHERTPIADDSRSKLSSEPAPSSSYDKRKEHNSRSPSSPRRVPYDHIPPHMAHYDPNATMYGPAPGYPPPRPHPWHDRPEYLADPHYPPPYYDPYDRRYGYHPYYYPHPPHPLPDSADHHRYPYPPPAYGRPPMYPGQPTPGYYDTPPRVPHPASESPGAVRPPPPYGYDPSSPYPPQRGGPWPHYGERSQSRDPNLESSSSPYRGSGPVTPPPPPRGHPMYYPPHDYYAPPYGHPMGPPPPKQDYSTPVDPSLTGDPSNPQNKIPIQDLLSTEHQQSHSSQPNQSNTEQSAATPPRMYGGPPSAFAHIYHRPHDYMRHDMYRPPYDMGYPPPHEMPPYQNVGSSSSPINKSQSSSHPPPQVSQNDGRIPATSSSSSTESVRQESRNVEYNSYDPARRSAYPEPPGNSSVSSNPGSASTSQASSYSGMPVITTASRTLPPPLLHMASSSGGNSIPPYHPATSTSSLHNTSTSSSQQLKSPPRTQTSQSSFDHSSYSQNRGSYGSDHGNGGNSSKNNGVSSSLNSGNNEKITSPRYPPRRQGDVEGERKNESVGGGDKY